MKELAHTLATRRLWDALKRQAPDELEAAVQAGGEVQFRVHGLPLLGHAVQRYLQTYHAPQAPSRMVEQSLEVVQRLLVHGAAVDAPDAHGVPVLGHVLRYQWAWMAGYYATLEQEDTWYRSPSVALTRMVDLLALAGANPTPSLGIAGQRETGLDAQGCRTLVFDCMLEHRLFRHGLPGVADAEAWARTWALLDTGLDIDHPHLQNGVSSLYQAIAWDHPEATHELLVRGATLAGRDHQATPMDALAWARHHQALDALAALEQWQAKQLAERLAAGLSEPHPRGRHRL